jgi:hypothetical protein
MRIVEKMHADCSGNATLAANKNFFRCLKGKNPRDAFKKIARTFWSHAANISGSTATRRRRSVAQRAI